MHNHTQKSTLLHNTPHNTLPFPSRSWETGFFVSQGGSWQSEYGAFFLGWYSGLLVKHARRVLGAAASVLHAPGRPRVLRAVSEVRCTNEHNACVCCYQGAAEEKGVCVRACMFAGSNWELFVICSALLCPTVLVVV
jgi:Glycosyl hydrolase family 14